MSRALVAAIARGEDNEMLVRNGRSRRLFHEMMRKRMA
jgi:hypothetical protein